MCMFRFKTPSFIYFTLIEFQAQSTNSSNESFIALKSNYFESDPLDLETNSFDS